LSRCVASHSGFVEVRVIAPYWAVELKSQCQRIYVIGVSVSNQPLCLGNLVLVELPRVARQGQEIYDKSQEIRRLPDLLRKVGKEVLYLVEGMLRNGKLRDFLARDDFEGALAGQDTPEGLASTTSLSKGFKLGTDLLFSESFLPNLFSDSLD